MFKGKMEREEINQLSTIYKRIKEAMKEKGYNTTAELNAAIEERRGFCPEKSLYTKLQKPEDENPEQGFYNMSIKNLFILAEALDVSTDYLLGRNKIKMPADKLPAGSLGLSDKSLVKLKEIHEAASTYDPSKIHSTSRYYLNPYSKVLEMLDWIICHTDINEEEEVCEQHDFLTTLYQLVMLNFEDYRGAVMEAVINSAQLDTYKERDLYEDLLYRYKNPVIGEDQSQIAEELQKARKAYVLSEEANEQSRRILEDIKNGIVSIGDPVTYDQVRVRLADPHDTMQKHIKQIIESWNTEYKYMYDREKEQQEKEYAEWMKNISGGMEFPISEDISEEDDVKPEHLYLPPFMRSMTVLQQKKYMAYEYMENTALEKMQIAKDGSVSFSNPGIKDFISIIKKAEMDRVGLYITDNGEVRYSSEKAMEPTDRAKEMFERSGQHSRATLS